MIPVQIRDVAFQVTDAHPDFWDRVNSGAWEPATFALFDRFITRDTTVLDIGGWIGPTAIYAAHRAKQVYAFEPDPVAFAVLARNRAANPELANVEVINAAVSTEDGETAMGSRQEAGDSGSSILFAESAARWIARTLRIDRFLAERQVRGPLFVKMDVEGFEYALLPTLLEHLAPYEYTAVVSLHPPFLWVAAHAQDPRTTLDARVRRRLGFIRAHWRLLRAARRHATVTDAQDRPLPVVSTALAVLRGRAIVPDDTLILRARRH